MNDERSIRIKYESALNLIERAMTEVTLDVWTMELEIRAKTLAEILEIPYQPPQRKRLRRVEINKL